MAYGLTSDLETARNDLTARINQRLSKGIAAGSIEEAQLNEDRRRMELLQALGELAKDPARAKAISDAASAQMASNRQAINDQSSTAQGNANMQAAANGMLGSSTAKVDQGKIAAAKAGATTTASNAVTDWEKAMKDADENSLSAQLATILAPTEAADAAAADSLRSYQTNLGMADQLRQVQQDAQGGLAKALGRFLDTGVTPVLSVAGNVARNRNADAATGAQINHSQFANNPTQVGLNPSSQKWTTWSTLFGR